VLANGRWDLIRRLKGCNIKVNKMQVEEPQGWCTLEIVKNGVTETGAADGPLWLACAVTIRQLYFPKQLAMFLRSRITCCCLMYLVH
jgi:hypothetical protein